MKLFFLLEGLISAYYINTNNTNFTLTNFSFGSCYNYRHKNKIFKTISKNLPQLWIWTGDAVYINSEDDPELMFKNIKEEKYYMELREKIPTIGIWDDHDYGKNDGNGYFKKKDLYKKFYLDFIDESLDSIRRKEGRGIYTSYSFGDQNTHRTAKVILLDTRYNKSSFFDSKSDILGNVLLRLGEDQWNWLENELTNSDETFTFLISGSQFLPFNRYLTESWYYNSRLRLFNLINKTKKSGVIIISGDIHSGQILRTPCILPSMIYLIQKNLDIIFMK